MFVHKNKNIFYKFQIIKKKKNRKIFVIIPFLIFFYYNVNSTLQK